MHVFGVLRVLLYSHILLEALGLQKSTDGILTSQRISTNRSPRHQLPSYMMHLYRTFTSNHTRPVDFIEEDSAKQADTVRSLIAKSLDNIGRHWVVTFDFSSLLADTKIQAAELRIRLPQVSHHVDIAVELQHKQDRACPAQDPCREQESLGLLPSTSMVSSTGHWRVYNVTSQLLGWMRDQPRGGTSRPEKVKRNVEPLHTSLPSPFTRPLHFISNRALLVVFSNTLSDKGEQDKASLLHTAEKSKFLFNTENKEVKKPRRQRSRRGRRGQPMRHLEAPKREESASPCRRVEMQVDFNQIGWGSWIVFPKKYNAYRCEGSCPSPLGEEFNPTNHAYMQSLLKYYHPNRVPTACCAPTKMSPLSMLYYEGGEMILRHHEDMIVAECGCH
ncbi:nodal-related 2 [Alosa alosa]|uniref:nodal-related 2 n=1 Tax=Alosa alosa TaxID=278164 RepID=UPI0020151175|nr:nodal-related 2 [Alosa alosa]